MSEQLLELLAKTVIRVFVKWGDELCDNESHIHFVGDEKRHACPWCWKELRNKGVEL